MYDWMTVVAGLYGELTAMREQMNTLQGQLWSHLELMQNLSREISELDKQIPIIKKEIADSSRTASEAVWAEIFNNTIAGSIWLNDRAFSPGRWAVGYQYLYVMYRVLNETHPKKILELGLGQSTRMIAQYAAAFSNIEHIVVEHDQKWIDFFLNSFHSFSEHSEIVKLERTLKPYKGAKAVRAYNGFYERFQNRRFDFISIDAPFGADMKQFARIDVLDLIPDCLCDDFVIMIDDAERSGESHTIAEIETLLRAAGIAFQKGKYSGQKDCVVICAASMGFLSTM